MDLFDHDTQSEKGKNPLPSDRPNSLDEFVGLSIFSGEGKL
jgi:hypothetical protein